jgi:hypothetical protein
MEYKLISEPNSHELGRRVSEYLAEGWELYGEPLVASYYANYSEPESGEHVAIFAQAIIRRDER